MTPSDASSDEILAALARADELLDAGHSLDAVWDELGISPATYRLWRVAHARTFVATARRVQVLEQVQAELLELIARQRDALRQLHARP